FSIVFAKLPQEKNFRCLSDECCDKHQWCKFWASLDECFLNPEWMLENCQISCNLCPNKALAESMNPSKPRLFAATGVLDECRILASKLENVAEEMIKKKLLNPIEDAFSRQLLSVDDITKHARVGCVPQLTNASCSQSLCYHLYYRSFDGACNNLEKPLLGAAFRPYLRQLPPEYDDGITEPVGSLKRIRPSARGVSRFVLSSRQVVTHKRYNAIIMQFGQFISHDIAKTTLQPTTPCSTCKPVPSKCMVVRVTRSDPNFLFKKKECLKISRAAPVCGVSPRQQLNENTAFVDASTLYGSSQKDIHKFRDGRTGFLRMNRFNNQVVLPFDPMKCPSLEKCTASFIAGDARVNLFTGLSAMHILFAREHNRLASVLHSTNPSWSGDRLFQEARKIVGAEVQVILYNEFLPKVLGDAYKNVIGSYQGYNPEVDPTISNVFTAAAYRFGHGMLQEFYTRLDTNFTASQKGFTFADGIFKIGRLLFEGGIDPVLRGLMMTPVKKPHRLTPSITEKMFGSTDLGTINIMRGRDHGLPSYNKWRRFCGLKFATEFDDFKKEILDPKVRQGLSKIYKSPNDVDLYVGAMVEDPVAEGLVGTTLACLVGNQFKRLRDGDRFYFENPGIFTARQLAELRKVTLSRIICDNGDEFDTIPKDAFLFSDEDLSSCSTIVKMDLKEWKE
ncbi:unnamed protein product, partial [Enterobius vermicularis]|uniref:peroxidase n=1 Tax=Enterobius vermicularis TaxID=51028 RepID=A0A0N4V6X0_ENTVE